MAGINIVRINYKGTGPLLGDLISGQVQMAFPGAGGVSSYIKSGRLKALGVCSAEPSALFPGLATIAASGLPGFENGTTYGVLAPARTPSGIVHRLNQEIVRVVNRADVKERLLNSGVEAVGSSPDEFAAYARSELARWGKLIKALGIRVD